MGIEMVRNKETKEPLHVANIGEIIAACKKRGLIIGKNGDTVAGFNNVLTLSPPLSSTDEDLDFMVHTMKEVISNY